MNYIIKIIKTDYDEVEETIYEDEIGDYDGEAEEMCEDEIIAKLLEDATQKLSN